MSHYEHCRQHQGRFIGYDPEPRGWKWALVVLLIALVGSIIETKIITLLIILVLIHGLIDNMKVTKYKKRPRDR